MSGAASSHPSWAAPALPHSSGQYDAIWKCPAGEEAADWTNRGFWGLHSWEAVGVSSFSVVCRILGSSVTYCAGQGLLRQARSG